MSSSSRVNWPASDLYKVIQIITQDQYDLLFGILDDFHSDTLKKFLDERKIKYDMVMDRDDRYVPALVGQYYRVCGMGRAIVELEERIAIFPNDSNSFGYSIGIDKEHLDVIRQQEPDWKIIG